MSKADELYREAQRKLDYAAELGAKGNTYGAFQAKAQADELAKAAFDARYQENKKRRSWFG